MPSISGIWTSLRTMSNLRSAASRKASAPLDATVTLDQAGVVRRKGKVVKPGKADKTAPKTTARVRRKGKKYIVKLAAHDAGTGVAATWVTIGTGKPKPKRYKKALTLTAKQLKSLRFSSVDRAGNLERSRRVAR